MIAAARQALQALMSGDPQFITAMQALGLAANGAAVTPKCLKGNRRFDQIGAEHLPCWVQDAGDQQPVPASADGDAMGLTINSHQQEWVADLLLTLVWHQQAFDTSVDQTDAIAPALVQLLLRNPSLDDTCDMAYVADVVTDRNYNHPLHAVTLVVRVHGVIHRE
ncbi:hypothetical protein LJR143_001690 [Pseudoxanthomonas sp. LjRoot143]|uniref:hypothetical protein n=1 Tax=Pseudoxanthomonas sp. LjRoot143 TaxID=3342266 RepID=UPI003ED119BE